ncbi:FHA domain-containing protein [bacterium]|nr:FHA domain-containing protein [bacterium]
MERPAGCHRVDRSHRRNRSGRDARGQAAQRVGSADLPARGRGAGERVGHDRRRHRSGPARKRPDAPVDRCGDRPGGVGADGLGGALGGEMSDDDILDSRTTQAVSAPRAKPGTGRKGGALDGRTPFVVVTSGADKGRKFLLLGSVTILGRSAHCHIPFHDPAVSGRHAEIHIDDQRRAFLVDLKSTNGSFVDGHRVDGRAEMISGSRIRVGEVEMLLTIPPVRD